MLYNIIVGGTTYMLRAILHNKNISLYQLEKTSHISHATLNDIYNEKSNINNCSIVVMAKLASALSMDIDELYKTLIYEDLSLFAFDDDFDLFKSNTLQQLKRMGSDSFIDDLIENSTIDKYYQEEDYLKALYLLSLVDYLTALKGLPLLKQFDYLRDYRLDKIYISKSLFLLLETRHITTTKFFKKCIKEFIEHNIVEAEIDDVI